MESVTAKNRLLMIIEGVYPAVHGGGLEMQVRVLARILRTRGYDVKIIAPMLWIGPQAKQDVLDGVEVFRIPYPRIRFLGGVIMLVSLGWYLYRRRREYDAIHAHMAGNMAAVAALVGSAAGKRVIVKPTGAAEVFKGILKDAPANPRIFLLRWALRRVSAFQAISTDIACRLRDKGFASDKVQWIPNVVEIERFPTTDNRRDNKTRIAVFLGRLEKEKGLQDLLNAWSSAIDPSENVKLLIIGSGTLREVLEEQVAELHIDHQINFLGSSQNPENYIMQADFGVLPSLIEGLSNTLLEFMAAGRPVLGSRISGTEDFIVERETGWLFNVGDTVQMAQRLRSAVRANEKTLRQMGANARARVIQLASEDAVVDKLLQLYGFTTTAIQLERGHEFRCSSRSHSVKST